MMDKNREAFEAWWKATEQDELRKSCAQGWGYYIWHSSRQAIEIELPGKWIDEDLTDPSYNLGLKHAAVAIKNAGIRVKGNEE